MLVLVDPRALVPSPVDRGGCGSFKSREPRGQPLLLHGGMRAMILHLRAVGPACSHQMKAQAHLCPIIIGWRGSKAACERSEVLNRLIKAKVGALDPLGSGDHSLGGGSLSLIHI